jgi:hypothetical protein
VPRIEGVSDRAAGPLARLVYWLARRRLGSVPEPLRILAHHPTILRGYGAFEQALGRAGRVETRLKLLAQLKAGARVGCPF